jgi:hypothetical protein
MRRFRSHAYAPRLICASLSAAACAVLVAACGPGTPGNSCQGAPFPDQGIDQGGGGGGGGSGDGGGGGPMKPSQLPQINPIFCQPQTCGDTTWQVSFSLPNPAASSGWVIQMVTDDLSASDNTSRHTQFWEAFYIAAGKTTTSLYNGVDDQYNAVKHPSNTTGTETVIGLAKFYEGTLPSDFVYCDASGAEPAGGRRFTYNQPAWWDGTGTPHNLTVMWDCTNGATVRNVQTTPAGACM